MLIGFQQSLILVYLGEVQIRIDACQKGGNSLDTVEE